MLQVNEKMLEAFKLYSASKTKIKPIPATTLAHRVVYAEAGQKEIELHYLDNGDVARSLCIVGKASLPMLERTHGARFLRINRQTLVNVEAITGVFPLGGTEFGMSVVGFTDKILPISRRCVKAAKAAYASKNVHI